MALYVFRKGIRKLPGDVIKLAPIPEPEVTQGFGTRERVGDICARAGYRSVLLVTDTTLFKLGYHKKIQESLEKHGIDCSVFSDISSEPTRDIIEAGRNVAAAFGADCIVALGGGSVLDSCKIIAATAKHPNLSVELYLQKFALVRGKTLPMISVPSTAGTGAEHTVGAVVKNTRGVKNSTVVIGLNVTDVILDSELTVNAPWSITAWCGIDALSHGLEGLMADVKSKKDDIKKSRECVKIVLENLPKLHDEPNNIEARQNMSLAAFYGGNAINKQLAGYVHAFAHSIGGLYHIPHGEAIAYCLIPVAEAQRDVCEEDLADLSRYCGFADEGTDDETAVDKLIEELKKLLELCGLPHGCSQINQKDFDKLIRMIDADSVNYSAPVTFTDREIRAMLRQIRKGV